jgi:hypothetical protein
VRTRPLPRPRLAAGLLTSAALVGGAVAGGLPATAAPGAPADRYALAGGCWAVQSPSGGGWVARAGDGFTASAGEADAEPFHLQATDLGSYLLFSADERFLAGSGSDVRAEAEPGEGADFVVDATGPDAYTLVLSDGRALQDDGAGGLTLGAAPGQFAFSPATGCADWPEVELNVTGEPVGGSTPWTEVAGYLDAHLHTMAFEFVGGSARCGRPWHPYGVEHALVDCPDHEPGGRGAALEHALSGTDPVDGHDTTGWPTFGYWPKHDSLTHEQVYHRWLERAWRGGLRMMTTLLVENKALCDLYPLGGNTCNEMDSVRLQEQRMREFERYLDAQSGGPGKGWLRIVDDPFEARRVMNEGRLAVVLGIEISQLFDCNVVLGVPTCTRADIDRQIDEMYALGVRQMELNNKFDNALAGVTGDSGQTGIVVNQGNRKETGEYWRMRTCIEPPDEHAPGGHDGHDHGQDRTQSNVLDDGGAPQFPERDGIVAGMLSLVGQSGVAPVYPPAPHCNELGLSDLGRYVLEQMMSRGMIFDPDHMSARARHDALDVLAESGYSGIVSSHSWSDDTVYPRVLEIGGVVTPYAGDSEEFVEQWRKTRDWARERDQYWGIGYGADTNGFGAQGGPRGAEAPDPVVYPFTGFGGVVIDQQVSGQRVYDVNVDGVAHYGLYPDWVEDLRLLAGPDIVSDLERGPEAYLQTWERADGVPAFRCHDPQERAGGTGLGALQVGMTTEQVLRTAGQPAERDGSEYRYCMTDDSRVVATFDEAGRLIGLSGAGAPATQAPAAPAAPATPAARATPAAPAAAPARPRLPATGPTAALGLGSLVALAAGAALRRRPLG